MDCLCGKKMTVIINEAPDPSNWTYRGQVLKPMKVWACPPEGCGRIYLEGSGAEIKGTFYTPEQNSRKVDLDG